MTTELLKNVTLQCVTRIPNWPCNFFSNIQVIPWFTQIGGLIMVHWTQLAFNFWKMERQVLEALIHFIGPWLLVDLTPKIAQMGTTELFVKGLQIWITFIISNLLNIVCRGSLKYYEIHWSIEYRYKLNSISTLNTPASIMMVIFERQRSQYLAPSAYTWAFISMLNETSGNESSFSQYT